MKQILLCFLVIIGISCTKEKSASIKGEWTIVETNAGTGYGWNTLNYQAGSDISIEFRSSGDFIVSGPKPGASNSKLWDYNKYELLADQSIRFYHTDTGKEMTANFEIVNGLQLHYSWARCGYSEKFVRN
ncbi:MAG TPA: hypothetical protein VGC29_01220 [Flavisolibacter sp.]